MWIDVRHPIQVEATFSRDDRPPRLDGFRTQGKWIRNLVTEAVEFDTGLLSYMVTGPYSRYSIQYDTEHQQWFLNAIHASGHLRAMPRPRCFPPP